MEQYKYENYEDYLDNQIKRAKGSQRKTRKRVKDFTKNAQHFKQKYPELKSVLCIGCRDKSEIEAFKDEGYDAQGIDLFDSEGIIKCDMSFIPDHPYFKFKKYDIVYMSHSLEHCMDLEGLRRGIQHLNPSLIYVECPLRDDIGAWDCSVWDFMKEPTDDNIDKLFSHLGYEISYIEKGSKFSRHSIIKFILIKE